MLEDPWATPPADVYEWTVDPGAAPAIPTEVIIGFEGGVPVALDGEVIAPVELVERLNALGGAHGVGRIDHVEDRLVGIKSREIYEAPAAIILHTAHAALEGLTLSKEQLRFNRLSSDELAQATYDGLWFSALHRDLREYVALVAAASSTARSGCVSTTATRSSSAAAATTRSTTARSRPTTRRTPSTTRPPWASSASSACRSRPRRRATARPGAGPQPLLPDLPVTVTRRARQPVDAQLTGLHADGDPMKAWGGRFSRDAGRARGRLRPVHRGRPGAGARRPRRAASPTSRGLGARGLLTADEAAHADRRPARAGGRGARRDASPGTRPSRTCTSTWRWRSRRASGRSPASCTRAARATTRSPRTCASGCAARVGDAGRCAARAWSAPWWASRSARSRRVMPGHTHVQPAQPVLFAHHLLAYVEMLERDRGRFADAAAARQRLAARLRRASPARATRSTARPWPPSWASTGVTHNSIDAVGDRDFVVEALGAAALAMVHLSRLAEEIVWWSHPRFGFMRLADAFSTGSSMMPNKRNPDPAELVRGRSARVIGHLTGRWRCSRACPPATSATSRRTSRRSSSRSPCWRPRCGVMAPLVASLGVDRERMREAATEGHITATAIADALVEEGVPFRDAHHVVGRLVAAAEPAGRAARRGHDDAAVVGRRSAASDDEAARALADDPGVGERVRAAAAIDGALARCDVVGGTAPAGSAQSWRPRRRGWA